MGSMDNVIFQLRNGNYIEAIKEYRNLTGALLKPSKDAVDALRPYLDPSCPEYVHKPQQPSEPIPEAIPEKAPIDKWVVTGISPRGNLYFIQYLSAKNAEEGAQIICNEGYKKISISQVIAEGKYTISL